MNKKILLLIIILLIGIILFGGIYFYKTQGGLFPSKLSTNPPLKIELPFKTALAEEKKLIKSHNIIYEPLYVQPQIPPYSLPLTLDQITNFQRFNSKLNLSTEVINGLLQKGFAVFDSNLIKNNFMGNEYFDRFETFYDRFRERCDGSICSEKENKLGQDVPFYITTDTLLHYYHLIFSSTLLKLERDLFFDNLWQFSTKMLEKSVEDYKNAQNELIKEAARRNIAYFVVTLKLLQPKEDQILTAQKLKNKPEYESVYSSIINSCGTTNASCIRKYIETNLPNDFSKNDEEKYKLTLDSEILNQIPEAEQEFQLIEEKKSFDFSPLFIYKEDYSQYVPRGHYSQGEKLKNYFKAMMWLGRMTMLAKGSESLQGKQSECLTDGIISVENAKIQTMQAALISQYFKENEALQKIWQKIYAVTSFFVGYSDDLGPYEYISVIEKTLQGQPIKEELVDKFQQAITTDLPNPKIYSGLGNCTLKTNERTEEAQTYLKKTKGFRLMGQRYVVDSYLMSKLVSPYTGDYTGDKNKLPFTAIRTEAGTTVRGFPRGLDIMALLDSERAKSWIKTLKDDNYSDYYSVFNSLNNEISSLTTENWVTNLYTSWLFALKPLFEKFGTGYPTFMQQEVYQDKLLTTALASWAELRHDTILYTKQSYTMSEGGFIPDTLPTRSYLEPIPEFYNRLLFLTKLTSNGLKNILSTEEYKKIFPREYSSLDSFTSMLEKFLDISLKEINNQQLTEEQYKFLDHFNEDANNLIEALLTRSNSGPVIFGAEKILKTTLVADVHTDGNSGSVLEEGVGYIKPMIVAYKLPDGRINIGLGPVFSYYEFKSPGLKRLTDEEWREILKTNPPSEPEWILNYLSK